MPFFPDIRITAAFIMSLSSKKFATVSAVPFPRFPTALEPFCSAFPYLHQPYDRIRFLRRDSQQIFFCLNLSFRTNLSIGWAASGPLVLLHSMARRNCSLAKHSLQAPNSSTLILHPRHFESMIVCYLEQASVWPYHTRTWFYAFTFL